MDVVHEFVLFVEHLKVFERRHVCYNFDIIIFEAARCCVFSCNLVDFGKDNVVIPLRE